LVGIDYDADPHTETVYYDKDLKSGGADCFTVEYDYGKDDLVAVPCGGRRQLRGHQ